MGQSWFTNQDRGELRIVKREDGWYVEPSDVSGETKCLIEGPIDTAADIQTVQAHIKSYRRGTGTSSNYLTIEIVNQDETESSTQYSSSNPTPSSKSRRNTGREHLPEWNLGDFSGSGKYVTIEAKVKYIEFVKKNTVSMPDMRGVLREEGSTKRLPFVIESGVNHPYLEAGKRFRFRNVKDHRYEEDNEVQVLITENTEFEEL